MCSETDFTQEKSHFHPTASNSSLLFVAAVTKWSASDIAEATKLKGGHEKSMFETPYNEIKCVLSIKNQISKWVKIFKFACKRSGPKGLPPPPPPPLCQPD